jgi:glutathione reductase (NADPH)
VNAARLMQERGVRAGGLSIDWPELMRFKRSFTEPVSASRREQLAGAGIETFDGVARFTGRAQVHVGDAVLDATRAIVIATGARPASLHVEGAGHVLTSDRFLELPALPASVIFVGGGYISFEFAHVAARAGARVTIVHRGQRPLEHFDPDLVERLVARMRPLGIDVRLGAEVRAIERVEAVNAPAYQVVCLESGRRSSVPADLVVHGAGRVPDLDELDLRAGGIESSRAGVLVDSHLRSVSNPMVWAAGDCAAGGAPPLTPVAGYEGRVVAANLLGGGSTVADYGAVPSVVFTLPPLARVGLSEAAAREKGLDVTIKHQDMAGWFASRRLGETASAFKTLVENGTGRILGAHLLGPGADETINLFALAMRCGMTADAFKQMLWAYPTQASDTAYMV